LLDLKVLGHNIAVQYETSLYASQALNRARLKQMGVTASNTNGPTAGLRPAPPVVGVLPVEIGAAYRSASRSLTDLTRSRGQSHPAVPLEVVGQDLGIETLALLHQDHYRVSRKSVQTILRENL
jgi:hypothetical protein